MCSTRHVIAVAREIVARHRGDAASLMDRRAQENARAGDSEAAIFWTQVAQAVRAMDTWPVRSQDKDVAPPSPFFDATPRHCRVERGKR
jgi:hypothetical protein